MICRFCEVEYAEGTTHCAQCGAELVESLPPETEELVMEPLGEIYRPRELDLVVGRLEEAEIPYVVHCGTGLAMMESHALSGTVHWSQWEARVLVVSSRHEEARAILEEVAGEMPDEEEEEEDR
jgi:hypothetical protein